VLSANDLAAYLETHSASHDDAEVNLLKIPAMRKDVANIDYRATVEEARHALAQIEAEALCVRRQTAPMIEAVMGIITQPDIDNYREAS
jgi:CIC family chloride channel protein